MGNAVLYLFTCVLSAAVVCGVLPLLKRFAAPRLLDKPNALKKHASPVAAIGGCAVFCATITALVAVRFITNFPTGTLHNLRGILLGGTLIFCLGILDDLHKPEGLPMLLKLCVQALAAGALIYYGVTIQIVHNPWLVYPFTFLWLVGLTNAFNLLDIQDGLCVSQAVICTLGLIFITLPSEFIYVNFAALALLGACLAFWPFNHAKQKIFLGDSGATFLGFMLASLSMGAGYSAHVSSGFLAPVFILAVVLFDTSFVVLARLLKHKNPLKGSDDHIALRLQRAGWPKPRVLLVFCAVGLGCNVLGFVITKCALPAACVLFAAAGLFFTWAAGRLLQCK